MATVSVRVPDEVKERMEAHGEINWSAVVRSHIEAELDRLESRSLAHAVSTSERLSRDIDPEDVSEANTADTIRKYRDERYGENSA
jgi:predicted DNA-binding protein